MGCGAGGVGQHMMGDAHKLKQKAAEHFARTREAERVHAGVEAACLEDGVDFGVVRADGERREMVVAVRCVEPAAEVAFCLAEIVRGSETPSW